MRALRSTRRSFEAVMVMQSGGADRVSASRDRRSVPGTRPSILCLTTPLRFLRPSSAGFFKAFLDSGL